MNSSFRQRHREKGREREKKNISKFKHGFLESAALCVFFVFFSQAQRPFQKERLILIIRRLFLFVLFCFVFHLCGGGRINGAGDSFDRPPRLSTQVHVKLSQLWLRSRHTITTRGTKGNSKKKKNLCANWSEAKKQQS